VERTLLTNQAGMQNLGADKQGLFSVALELDCATSYYRS